MLGQDFERGVIYQTQGRWLKVKTRGPVITRGVERPIVRLTARDQEGAIYREQVDAYRDYPTVDAFRLIGVEGAIKTGHSMVAQRRTPMPPRLVRGSLGYGSVERERASVVPRRARPRVIRTPVAEQSTLLHDSFEHEACYWIPPNISRLCPAEEAVATALSVLSWVDAPAARWSSEGEIIEHDAPEGCQVRELAARLHRTETPDDRQIHAVERALDPLRLRKIVEVVPGRPPRFRLRGWECLHTRRRTTRRAIEHGGGRAVFASVRFSA